MRTISLLASRLNQVSNYTVGTYGIIFFLASNSGLVRYAAGDSDPRHANTA